MVFATCFFDSCSDAMRRIRSFTNMAAKMDPLEVVNMLNELHCIYDGLVDKHHVYKVRRASAARPQVVGERSSKFIFYEAGKLCSPCFKSRSRERGTVRRGSYEVKRSPGRRDRKGF